MDQNNNTGGVNTILIVILLLIIVAVGVWYFTKEGGENIQLPVNDSLNIDLSLGEENGEALPQ